MTPQIEIIDFTDDLQEPIKTLNYEWLEKYFKVETADAIALANPKTQIIDKGGFIFYARYAGEIVGTASLLKYGDDRFEIGKMAVSQKAQGIGIGKALLEHCLHFAQEKAARSVFLYSNTILEPAIALYRKFGFVAIPLEKGLYERANIKMEKQFQQ